MKSTSYYQKLIDGKTVIISLTVEGAQHADWSNRLKLAEKELDGWTQVGETDYLHTVNSME